MTKTAFAPCSLVTVGRSRRALWMGSANGRHTISLTRCPMRLPCSLGWKASYESARECTPAPAESRCPPCTNASPPEELTAAHCVLKSLEQVDLQQIIEALFVR